jgi:hypothetical protein
VRTLRKLLVALGLVGAALVVWTTPAPAQAPDQQGWWWLAGATGIAPPGVPDDGLYVASNPSGTQGVSALKFTLAGGGGAGTLRLDLAGAPSGTPSIGLCVLSVEWTPAQGGALSNAPACAQGGATAAGLATADGQSYTFTVSGLVSDGVLNVAVIPSADSGTFSVAFKKPAGDALTPVGTSAPADTGAPSPSPSPEPSPAPAPSFAPAPSYNASPPPFEPELPDAPITGSSPSSSSTGSTGSGVGSSVAGPRTETGSSHSGWRIAGFALIGLTAIAYHRLSVTPDRAPRSLVTFGQLASEEQSQG